MAGLAMLLRYQWRAYWRRFHRGGGPAIFQLLVSVALAWLIFLKLPPMLSHAARDLGLGKTDRIEIIMLMFAFAWLYPLLEDSNISITPQNLLRFPLTTYSLLTVRIFSVFISPVAMLLVIGSVMSLYPFLKSRYPLIGMAAAILFYAVVVIAGLCLSHLIVIPLWRGGLLAAVAIIMAPIATPLFAGREQALHQLLSMIQIMPAHLATRASTAESLESALIPFLLLLAVIALTPFLLVWSFRQSLSAQQITRSSLITRIHSIRLPGKLGGLVGKEQRYFRKSFFLWLGFLFSLACSFALLKNVIPPIIFQIVILSIFSTNIDLMMNCFGLDRASELYRYLLFPLNGKQLLLSKNLGIAVIVTAQLLPMILLAWWRFGGLEALYGLIQASVLTAAHLAWGNWRSVSNPGKMSFYLPDSGGNPLIALAGFVIGSLPGIAVVYSTHSDSDGLFIKLSFILLLTAGIYYCSTHSAGQKFERNWQKIIDRLS